MTPNKQSFDTAHTIFKIPTLDRHDYFGYNDIYICKNTHHILINVNDRIIQNIEFIVFNIVRPLPFCEKALQLI